jgi:hypothetical protein
MSDEKLKTASNGQWALIKSNYGPKGANLYDPHVNQKRKANNTGDSYEDIGQNKTAKEYTSAKEGTAQQQASALQAKQKKLNANQPVKTSIDPEQTRRLLRQSDTIVVEL